MPFKFIRNSARIILIKHTLHTDSSRGCRMAFLMHEERRDSGATTLMLLSPRCASEESIDVKRPLVTVEFRERTEKIQRFASLIIPKTQSWAPHYSQYHSLYVYVHFVFTANYIIGCFTPVSHHTFHICK